MPTTPFEARIAELGARFQRLRRGEDLTAELASRMQVLETLDPERALEFAAREPYTQDLIAEELAKLWDDPERAGSRAEQRPWLLQTLGPPTETTSGRLSDHYPVEVEGFAPTQPVVEDVYRLVLDQQTDADALCLVSAGDRVLLVNAHFAMPQ
jgi:hypothetical protein